MRKSYRPTIALLIALVIGVTSSGCSVFAVRTPAKSKVERVDVACTSDPYAPALDVGSAVSGVASVIASDSVQDSPGLVLVGTAAFLLSAVYGYYWTAECAEQKNLAYEAHAEMLLRQMQLMDTSVRVTRDKKRPPPPPPPPPQRPPPATDEFDTEPKPTE